MIGQTSIRCLLMPDAPNADGEPRAALLLPPLPGTTNRRPLLRVFATVALALEAKRGMEGGHARS